jgi:DNA-directed RNA polymerase II subunit RPB1
MKITVQRLLFDGDEMNLHAPQSVEAATELREIAAVPLQIVSPRESQPIVSVVQDTLVGANRFTRDGVLFNRREAMNLLVHAKRWDGLLPPPKVTEPQEMWSGRQLLSALLPPVNLKMKNSSEVEVEIENGIVKENSEGKEYGMMDKNVFGKKLLHIIYNDYGHEVTVDFLDSLQAMIANYLMNSGFSVGVSDLIADEGTNRDIAVKLDEITKNVETQILQLHMGLFENNSGRSNQEEFESKLMGILNQAYKEAGKIGLTSLADTNRMTNMVKAGSKGSDVNVSQMIATLGQLAIEGKRVPNGFQHRTLPHFKRFDDSARARGFVASSFIKGLQPDEFFFHAMSGREGLIDTAVKTADTGYMQRQIRVALEDLVSQHDGSVCDATGNILQISYGEDGMNATKLEKQPYVLGKMSDDDIAAEFAAEGAPNAAQYIEEIKSDRKMLVEKIFKGKPQGDVTYPVNLSRVIDSLRGPFNMRQGEGSVTATEVLAMQSAILNRTHAHNRLWAGLVRFHLRPTKLRALGFTPEALQALGEQIVLKHMQAWVEPGQPVGVIAAQSIGEPATQMTLNTFHLAGVAAKSNMTRGVPRLKELLKATRNPKAIELTIPLRPDLRTKKEEARRVAQDLEFTLLQDLIHVSRIYYDPKDSKTLIESDTDWLTYTTAFENLSVAAGEDQVQSPWMLRFELDRQKMFTKNIAMDDIAYILKSRLGGAAMHYTDYNSSRLVFRIRLPNDDQQKNQIDQLNALKILQNKLLSTTAVRGIPGLRAVNYQKIKDIHEYDAAQGKYVPIEQFMLLSDGSNFMDVLAHPDVDATRLYSSNMHDMMENLGIEACRAALFKEITTLFEESGSTVNYRHVSILIDKMCHKGRTMSVDRYGIQKNDIGPLAKMSFEQTEDIALRAAMFGEQDPCLGISAKVMLGAPIKAGTSFSEILFDEEIAMRLAETAPQDMKLVRPKPLVAYNDEEIDARVYGGMGDEDGACNLNELRMNVALPNVALGSVPEGDEDDIEIATVD